MTNQRGRSFKSNISAVNRRRAVPADTSPKSRQRDWDRAAISRRNIVTQDLGGYELIAILQWFPSGFFPVSQEASQIGWKPISPFAMTPARSGALAALVSERLIPPAYWGDLLRMLGVIFGHLVTHALDAAYGPSWSAPTSDAAFLRRPCVEMVLVPFLATPHLTKETRTA
jgi:hypothetical protein